MRALCISFILIFSTIVHASECSKIVAKILKNTEVQSLAIKENELSIGSKVHLLFENGDAKEVSYLGSTIKVSGKKTRILFYDGENNGAIHIIERERLVWAKKTNEHFVVHSLNQSGPTCAAFSLFNCLRELNLRGKNGNGEIINALSDEESRSSLLTTLISKLYLTPEAKGDELPEQLLRRYGYEVFNITPNKSFKDEIKKHLLAGEPVLLSYDTASEMSTTPYNVLAHELTQEEPTVQGKRLWIPKEDGDVSISRHMVLAQGIFESNGKMQVLILDPNYQVPRIWSFDLFDRFESSNMYARVLLPADP